MTQIHDADNINAGENMEQEEFSFTAGGNAKGIELWSSAGGF